jgi:hypothetical protein
MHTCINILSTTKNTVRKGNGFLDSVDIIAEFIIIHHLVTVGHDVEGSQVAA